MVKALLPPNRNFALRALHLLVVPIDGALVNTVGTFDFGLPARGGAAQSRRCPAHLDC